MKGQGGNPGGAPGPYYAPAPGSPYAPSEDLGGTASPAREASGPCPARCTSPEEVFGLAASLAVFLRAHLTTLETQTLINLLTLLVANLSTMVIQQQLCEGIVVTPPEA